MDRPRFERPDSPLPHVHPYSQERLDITRDRDYFQTYGTLPDRPSSHHYTDRAGGLPASVERRQMIQQAVTESLEYRDPQTNWPDRTRLAHDVSYFPDSSFNRPGPSSFSETPIPGLTAPTVDTGPSTRPIDQLTPQQRQDKNEYERHLKYQTLDTLPKTELDRLRAANSAYKKFHRGPGTQARQKNIVATAQRELNGRRARTFARARWNLDLPSRTYRYPDQVLQTVNALTGRQISKQALLRKTSQWEANPSGYSSDGQDG